MLYVFSDSMVLTLWTYFSAVGVAGDTRRMLDILIR